MAYKSNVILSWKIWQHFSIFLIMNLHLDWNNSSIEIDLKQAQLISFSCLQLVNSVGIRWSHLK